MPRILFIGDIVGRPGRTAIIDWLPRLREERGIDAVIANGENAAAGAGITARLAGELLAAGVNAITLGDHVWDQRGFEMEIAGLERVCRPANLPEAQPGRTSLVITCRDGFRLGIFTVLGRVFVGMPSSCPFAAADRELHRLDGLCDGFLTEIHAEATAEKIAFGHHMDGRATLVPGTHTHVPTADACILPKGTAYITDVGMTGPHASVLGREIEPVVAKFLDGLPRRFEVASGDVRLNAVEVVIDTSGRAVSIERIEKRA